MSKRPLDKIRYKQYLYKLTFPNGMVYIGVAYDVKERWKNNGAGYKGQRVWEFIQEFGWENIKHEVLLYLPLPAEKQWAQSDKLRKLETELIHAYGDKAVNEMSNSEFHKKLTAQNIAKGRYERTVYWEVDGIVKPAVDWCLEYGVNYVRIKRIMDTYGFSAKQALLLPPVAKNMTRHAIEYWKSLGYLQEA